MALKIRRGTTAQRLLITPAEGEIIYDTTTGALYVGNGTTAGGNEVVSGSVGGNLVSDLVLSGYNITGAGNININGTITATGNITLGDANTDNVTFNADINSNLLPDTTNTYDIGSLSKKWKDLHVRSIFTEGITIDGDKISTSLSNADLTIDLSGTGKLQVSGDANIDTAVTASSLSLTNNINGSFRVWNQSVVNNLASFENYNDSGQPGLIDFLRSRGTQTGQTSIQPNDLLFGLNFSAWEGTANISAAGILATVGPTVSTGVVSGILSFFTQGTDGSYLERVIIDQDGILTANYGLVSDTVTGEFIRTEGLQLFQNNITARNTNEDVIIQGSGTAGVIVGDYYIVNGSITPAVSNGDIVLDPNGSGDLNLRVTTASTVGSAGAADPVPASPALYLVVKINGTQYKIPAFDML